MGMAVEKTTPPSEQALKLSELAVQAKTDPAYMEPLWEEVRRFVGKYAYKHFLYSRERGTRLYDDDDLMQVGIWLSWTRWKNSIPMVVMVFSLACNFVYAQSLL
jgi:hypothetical protein